MVVKVGGLNTSANIHPAEQSSVQFSADQQTQATSWLQRHSGEPKRPRVPKTTSEVDYRVVSGFNTKHFHTDVLSRLRHTRP